MTQFKQWDIRKSKVLVALYLPHTFTSPRGPEDNKKHIYQVIGLNILNFIYWNNYRSTGSRKNSTERSPAPFIQFPPKVTSYTTSYITMVPHQNQKVDISTINRPYSIYHQFYMHSFECVCVQFYAISAYVWTYATITTINIHTELFHHHKDTSCCSFVVTLNPLRPFSPSSASHC